MPSAIACDIGVYSDRLLVIIELAFETNFDLLFIFDGATVVEREVITCQECFCLDPPPGEGGGDGTGGGGAGRRLQDRAAGGYESWRTTGGENKTWSRHRVAANTSEPPHIRRLQAADPRCEEFGPPSEDGPDDGPACANEECFDFDLPPFITFKGLEESPLLYPTPPKTCVDPTYVGFETMPSCGWSGFIAPFGARHTSVVPVTDGFVSSHAIYRCLRFQGGGL